jgi:predicted nucleic acid-binding protein
MTVVDASVMADALRGAGGPAAAAISTAATPLGAPELLDLEVASAYRRLAAAGTLDPRAAEQLLGRLRLLPLERYGHAALLPRIWELRTDMSVYDAAYVALAESLGSVLLTRDKRLATAPRARCQIQLVA